MESDFTVATCIIIAFIAGYYFVRWWNKYETERKTKTKTKIN
jgi:hypothetical protein